MNINTDMAYQLLIAEILRDGEQVQTRNANVRRLFAETLVFHRTPLVSVRKTAWRNALRELEWILSGSDNINDLHESVRHWWEPWANKAGVIWGNYGKQLRHYANGFDQIAYLKEGIRDHPRSRRNVITTWNTQDMYDPRAPITNCWGTVIQAFVGTGGLHLVTYQRSADVICGLPHNWLQIWAFLLWLAHSTRNTVGSLTWIGGDIHVYSQHEDLAQRILDTPARNSPELLYTASGEEFLADDFRLDDEYRPGILETAEMVV